jgi:hypothetical protein
VPITTSGCLNSSRTWSITAASISPAEMRRTVQPSSVPFSTAWAT